MTTTSLILNETYKLQNTLQLCLPAGYPGLESIINLAIGQY